MEIRKKTEATRHENTPTCTAYEYSQPTNEIDAALIELSGRYPEMGWTINTVCTSIVHIIEGEGTFLQEGASTPLHVDDQLYIGKGEKYAFEGDVKLLFCATPAWSPEQAQTIPE